MTLPRPAAATALCALVPLAIASCDAPFNHEPTGLQVANAGEFVTTGGAEITLIVDDFTVRRSFEARRLKDLSATGEFQFVEKLFGSTLHAHGDITCFTVTGNRARLGGVITQSNTPGFVGAEVIWTVEDNGEGSNATGPDRATALQFGPAEPYCLVPPVPDPTLLPIETGDVQVHG